MKRSKAWSGEHIHEGPAMGQMTTLLLLFLCHTCCALEITAPSTQVAIVQTDALLPCTFRVVKPPINLQYLAIFWRFGDNEIARYDTKTKGSTSRFVINEQAITEGDASLTIYNVTVSDKGIYKCTVVYSPDTQEKELRLRIVASPSVNIKASTTLDGNDLIYMCEAINYFPEKVTMHWLLDGKTIDSPQQSNNGYFNKEIYHHIPKKGNNPPSQISCEVQHEALNRPIKITEEVKMERDCNRTYHFGIIVVLVLLLVISLPGLWYFMKRDSQMFQISHIHKVQTGHDKVTFYCTASNCPHDVRVTWMIKENDGEKIIISDNEQKTDEEAALIVRSDYTVETERSYRDNLHHAIAALSFTPVVSKHKMVDVSCKFLCNKQTREKSLTSSFTFKKPEVSGPMQMSLGDNGDVLCSVSLQKFYPKNIKIKWSHGLGHFQDVETLSETFTKNEDFTSNVRSVCRVPGHLLKDPGYRVRAAWSHETETGQQEVSLTDSCWRPVMGEIEKPDFIDGKEAKLICRVCGYFPDVLEVKWLRRDAESEEIYVISANDKYKIPVMEATQQEDKTFTYTACLIVSVSLSTDYGAEFMCRVRHPSVETPREKRTGEIRVIGIRAVNVMCVNKDKIRAEVSHFTPEEIKITWSRSVENKNYEDYKDSILNIQPNADGTNTAVSEITMKSHFMLRNVRKHYKVIVEHEATSSVIEKIVLRENDEFYLIDNEKKKKIPLPQIDEAEDWVMLESDFPHQKQREEGSSRGMKRKQTGRPSTE